MEQPLSSSISSAENRLPRACIVERMPNGALRVRKTEKAKRQEMWMSVIFMAIWDVITCVFWVGSIISGDSWRVIFTGSAGFILPLLACGAVCGTWTVVANEILGDNEWIVSHNRVEHRWGRKGSPLNKSHCFVDGKWELEQRKPRDRNVYWTLSFKCAHGWPGPRDLWQTYGAPHDSATGLRNLAVLLAETTGWPLSLPPGMRAEIDEGVVTSYENTQARTSQRPQVPLSSNFPTVVQNKVVRGEKLLWSGQPDPKRSFSVMLGIWIFAVPWTAGPLFIMWAVASGIVDLHGKENLQLLFLLSPIPFLLVGLAMMSLPYWAYHKAKRTVYAITDRRVLIIDMETARTIESYSCEDIGDIQCTERTDGTGDITISPKLYGGGNRDARAARICLGGIHEVRLVEDLLRNTFEKG